MIYLEYSKPLHFPAELLTTLFCCAVLLFSFKSGTKLALRVSDGCNKPVLDLSANKKMYSGSVNNELANNVMGS